MGILFSTDTVRSLNKRQKLAMLTVVKTISDNTTNSTKRLNQQKILTKYLSIFELTDGVFILFARRDKHHVNSIINALNASSLLAQFISVDLAEIFKKNDINPLRIRVGIDYGDKDKVLWSYYGISGCDELTTTSLHTDMAAKLQAKANDNCVVIGNNLVIFQ